jgi:hypothetical protein
MARLIPGNTGADMVRVVERRFLTVALEYLDDEFVIFHSIPWAKIHSRQI